MEKPITLVVEDFKKKLISDINESNIPAFILEQILKDIYNEVRAASIQQLELDRKKYEEEKDE